MLHRHLTHQQFTLAAIDDINAQRYHFWKAYAERYLA